MISSGLASTSLPLEEAVPLLASLLALPLPEGAVARGPLSGAALESATAVAMDAGCVGGVAAGGSRTPTRAGGVGRPALAAPSTLETLGSMVEQAPTVTMLHVLTFRPERTHNGSPGSSR